MMSFTIRKEGESWFLFNNGKKDPRPFTTITQAKRHCWNAFNQIPVVKIKDAVPFNVNNPLHMALLQIEARSGPDAEIMSVTPTHYVIRRNKFAAERLIRYTVNGDEVRARNDTELLQTITPKG